MDIFSTNFAAQRFINEVLFLVEAHLQREPAARHHMDFQTDRTEEWANHITIAVQKRFDLRTGQPVDELS